MGTKATQNLIDFMTGKSKNLASMPTEKTAIAAFHEQADNVENAKMGRDRIALFIVARRLLDNPGAAKGKLLEAIANELDLAPKYKSYLKGGMLYFAKQFQPQSDDSALPEAVNFIRNMQPLRNFNSKGELKAETPTDTTGKKDRRKTDEGTKVSNQADSSDTPQEAENVDALTTQEHILQIQWHLNRLKAKAEAGDALAMAVVEQFATVEMEAAKEA